MNRIYLDYNATAPIRPAVQNAVAQALELGNPSAVHAEGRRARAAVEQARASVASYCTTRRSTRGAGTHASSFLG